MDLERLTVFVALAGVCVGFWAALLYYVFGS